jgi:hypothetical protein
VDVCDDDDPTFDRTDGCCFGMCLHVGFVARGGRGRARLNIDVHFHIGHFDCSIWCESISFGGLVSVQLSFGDGSYLTEFSMEIISRDTHWIQAIHAANDRLSIGGDHSCWKLCFRSHVATINLDASFTRNHVVAFEQGLRRGSRDSACPRGPTRCNHLLLRRQLGVGGSCALRSRPRS